MVIHKTVTYERGFGYSARCDTCGDITFGGFATRSAARAALVHEETPAEMQLDEGQETPKGNQS